ncbi:MAG: DinB family protein [Bacteroidota bacterium]
MQDVLRNLQNLGSELMLQAPKSGAWSIAQCIEHLITYGHHYHPLLTKNLKTRSMAKDSSSSLSLLGRLFTRMVDDRKKTLRCKTIPRHRPTLRNSPAKIISKHLNQQEELLVLLRGFQGYDLSQRTLVSSISRVIKLNPLDVVSFLVTHNQRHINQAMQVLQCIS